MKYPMRLEILPSCYSLALTDGRQRRHRFVHPGNNESILFISITILLIDMSQGSENKIEASDLTSLANKWY